MRTKDATNNALRASFEYLSGSRKTSFRELASFCGCTARHLSGMVSAGKTKPRNMSGDLAHKIAEFYGLDYGLFLELGERILSGEEGGAVLAEIKNRLVPARQELHLLYRGDAPAPSSNVEPAPMPARGRIIPLISSVRAGVWTAAEGLEPGEADDWVDAPAGVGSRAFALRVKGDSMEPRFQEGEIIIVDPDIEAASGDYVVASLEREEATLKRYMREGGRDWLVPLNRRYEPIDMSGRDWRIVGRVMEKRQRF